MKRILAFFLALVLCISQFVLPVYANNPEPKGFSANINIGGAVYPCIVELGDWVTIGQTTDLSYTGMAVCFGLYFLGGDRQWYLVRDGELIGSPSDYFDIEITAAKGSSLLGEGTWKHDWDGNGYYYEVPVLNKEAAVAELDFSVRLKDTEGVGNSHSFSGTVQRGWATAPISIGGVVYDCWTEFSDPVTSGGSANIPNNGTVCFPLTFFSGGSYYPVFSNELQGNPSDLYNVEFDCSDSIAVKSWKWSTWPSNQYFVEAIIENKNATESEYSISCTLVDKDNGVKSATKSEAGTISAGSLTMPIKLGGIVYDMGVFYDEPQILPGIESIPNSVTVRYYLKFTTNGQDAYNVREGELQGIPTDFVTLENDYKDNALYEVGKPVVGKYHYDEFGDFFYVDYLVSGKKTAEYDYSFGAFLKHHNITSPVKTVNGHALGNRITAPINIGGVVYTCDIDFDGYLTSTGTNDLPSGGTVCLPLMFLGGDGVYYPVLASELQGTPETLGLTTIIETSGFGYELSDPKWCTWENGHYFAEYTVINTGNKKKNVSFTANLSQKDVIGRDDTFTGSVDASNTRSEIGMDISLDGVEYSCIVGLGDATTLNNITDFPFTGYTIGFGLYFLGGDGQWYLVRDGELVGSPSDYVDVQVDVTEGSEIIGDGIWKHDWDGNGYYYEVPVLTNTKTESRDIKLSVKLKQNTLTSEAKQFSGSIQRAWPVEKYKIGNDVFDCYTELHDCFTSSGSTELKTGDTIAFPLCFLGGDGLYYPALNTELLGNPEELFELDYKVNSEAELSDPVWKTFESGQYYVEFTAYNKTKEFYDINISCNIKDKSSGIYGMPQKFSGKIDRYYIYAPIKIDGIVYDCIVDLDGYLTSSGSDMLPAEGTVCFPLMFIGGDGKSYPVLKNELTDTPDKLGLKVISVIENTDIKVSDPVWKTWENGHYYAEYTILNEKTSEKNFTIKATLDNGVITGNTQVMNGKVQGKTVPRISAEMIIDGKKYSCFMGLGEPLTSSGNSNIPSGGTVCFPLMFEGADGKWYPVLKNELQGNPEKLFEFSTKFNANDAKYIDGKWQTWENGHYFIEYRLAGGEKKQSFEISSKITKDGLSSNWVDYKGTVGKALDIPQATLTPSACLNVERLEECKEFNTNTFTISGINYNQPWPVDFTSPNTTDATLKDGSVIRAELCFMVNNTWYPVRNNEVNENIEEMYDFELNILSGEDCLGTPKFTTRLDNIGDIWQFEIPVRYIDENNNKFSFTLNLVSKQTGKKGSVYKVSGEVQNNGNEFIVVTDPAEETEPSSQPAEPDVTETEENNIILPIIIAGVLAIAIICSAIIVILRRKKNNSER